jgi:hypothetical protein
MDEPLPPEFQAVADETERRKALEAEEFVQRQKAPQRRITRALEPTERPFPNNYPKQGF